MVTVVTINYNDADTIIDFISRIKEYDIVDHIIVVDNKSTDDSYDRIKSYIEQVLEEKYNNEATTRKIEIISSGRNGGYGYGNNFGIQYAWEKYSAQNVIVSNPDVYCEEIVLVRLQEALINNRDIAVAAPIMKNTDGTIEEFCAWKILSGWKMLLYRFPGLHKMFRKRLFYDLDNEFDDDGMLQVDCVAGSMLMLKTPYFLQLGGYDERMFLYCEETVLGIRLKNAGLKSYLLKNQFFVHRHGVTIGKFANKFEQERMIWMNRLFILREYYGFKSLSMIIANICVQIALVLRRVKFYIK